MADDIVTRLRGNDCFEFPSCDDVKQQAADEIERLRKMAYAMIDELRQNGGYEPYTTQMLFNEFYKQAVKNGKFS